MDIRQFEYVLSIAQYKSISKAAESLHVSQPTLSQFLSRLEKELGTSLFWRTRNGFIPTEAGKEYLQGAQAILDITRNISGKIEKLKERKNNRIVVGLSHGRSAQFFSKFLPNFHKRCPDFEIEMVQATSFNIDELVRNGYLDLALLVQDPESVGLEFETCTTEELIFIVAKKNPLVKELALEGKSRIEPGELFRFKDEGLIVSKKGYRLRTVVERYLRKIGLSLRVAVETTENDLTCNLVASGEGVGFVPIAYMGSHSDLIGFSLNPKVTWEYGVEYREGLQITPCMRRFIDDFKAYASVDSNW